MITTKAAVSVKIQTERFGLLNIDPPSLFNCPKKAGASVYPQGSRFVYALLRNASPRWATTTSAICTAFNAAPLSN